MNHRILEIIAEFEVKVDRHIKRMGKDLHSEILAPYAEQREREHRMSNDAQNWTGSLQDMADRQQSIFPDTPQGYSDFYRHQQALQGNTQNGILRYAASPFGNIYS